MRPILICIFALLSPSVASAAATVTREVVPMRFYGTRPAVEVRVNGQGPFLFLIDTGAGGPPARADVSLVKRLSLVPAGKTMASDAGGAAVSIDKVTISRIEIGNLNIENIEALSRNYNGTGYLPHLDGILGLNFFRDVILTLDYPHGLVSLSRGKLPPADGKTILDYELIEGNPAVTIQIGGQTKKVLFDTGDIRALDLPTSWLPAMPLASFPRLAGSSSSVSGTTSIREVELALPLLVGQHRVNRPRITFSDDFDVANLGSAFLRDFVVTIDQVHQRIRLVKPRK